MKLCLQLRDGGQLKFLAPGMPGVQALEFYYDPDTPGTAVVVLQTADGKVSHRPVRELTLVADLE